MDDAFSKCDEIKNELSIDMLTYCEKGVLVENAVYMQRQKLSNQQMIQSCEKMGSDSGFACATQLNGLDLMDLGNASDASLLKIGNTATDCWRYTAIKDIQLGCISSVALSAVEHTYASNNFVPPAAVLLLPDDLKREYIYTSNVMINRLFYNDVTVNWSKYCSVFAATYEELCLSGIDT
jgi:hypothetical protein